VLRPALKIQLFILSNTFSQILHKPSLTVYFTFISYFETMGIIRMGIPKELTLKLKEKLAIQNFSETATFKGGATFGMQHYLTEYIP
jgi:hypothetical protein